MLVGRFRASLAHEHVWCRVHVRPELGARCAHRALSVFVDQEHGPTLASLRTLDSAQRFERRNVSRGAGFVRLRSKPPCLITLTARGVASLRSTAVPPTSTPTPDAFPANRDGLPGSGASLSPPTQRIAPVLLCFAHRGHEPDTFEVRISYRGIQRYSGV